VKSLVRYIVEALVDDVDAVRVEEVDEGDARRINVGVAERDRGGVIGRQGRTIRAIETVVAAATTDGRRTFLKNAE